MGVARHYVCCDSVELDEIVDGEVRRRSMPAKEYRRDNDELLSSGVHDRPSCVRRFYWEVSAGDQDMFNFLFERYLQRQKEMR